MRIESCLNGRVAGGILPAALLLLECFFGPGHLQAESVTLAWDPNTEPDLAGYYIYYGEQGAAPQRVDAGLNTTLTIDDLTPGLTYVFYATAFNTANLESDPSESVTYTFPDAQPVPPAWAVSGDTTTQGNWKGIYGEEGLLIFAHAVQPPAYADLTLTGGAQWVWGEPASDPAALEKVYAPGRFASCWYGQEFTLNLDWTGSTARQLALYFLDWDLAGRVQEVEFHDTQTGELLYSTTLSEFHDGVYLLCPLDRDLQITVRQMAGPNAVISGVFYGDGAPPLPIAGQPVISPAGGTFSAPVQVAMTAPTTGSVIHFTLDGSTPDTSSPVYSGPITISANSTLTARAFAQDHQPSPVARAEYRFSTGQATASVSFAGTDLATQGSWTSKFGDLGFLIVADWTAIPETVAITASGQNEHIWVYQTDDPAALEKFSSASRLAACWYASDEFELEVEVNEAEPREVTLYCLDWDHAGRSQVIEVYDAGTGELLDSQLVESFEQGIHLTWNVQGQILLRLVNQGPSNAVLSGVFID